MYLYLPNSAHAVIIKMTIEDARKGLERERLERDDLVIWSTEYRQSAKLFFQSS